TDQYRRKEARLQRCLVKIFYLIAPKKLSPMHPSYMRESKAYRRGTKSAINYVQLLIICMIDDNQLQTN
ncbi:hypothetical protein AM228_23105, partial [Planktothricoides sp. SR001]